MNKEQLFDDAMGMAGYYLERKKQEQQDSVKEDWKEKAELEILDIITDPYNYESYQTARKIINWIESNKTPDKIKDILIMTHGSLFSGIGGFDLAAEWMGWENIFHCEINKFCQKVLKYHFPKAELFTDITKTDFTKYANSISIVTGGFPCQPYSVAGNRKGKADDRHLWPEMLRAIKEIQPSWIVGENVPGLINWGGVWYSTKSKLTWKLRGLKFSHHLYCQLAVSMPHTDEIGFGLLLTPTQMNIIEHPIKMRERAKKKGYKNGTKWNSLISQMVYGLLPTPTASDSKGESKGSKRHMNKDMIRRVALQKNYDIADSRTYYPHPEFLEQMMGYPMGWTELKH